MPVVSHETVCWTIYVIAHGELRKGLIGCLRQAHKTRGAHGPGQTGKAASWTWFQSMTGLMMWSIGSIRAIGCGSASEFGSEALSLRVECPILVSLIWMSSDHIWGAKPSTLGPIAARQVIAQTWRAANNFLEFSPVSHFCNQCPGLAKADPYLSCVASRSTMLAVASFMPMIATSML